MSLPTKEEWLDKWPEHEKGWTSRAIAAYPRDTMAALTAENAALRAEVERLRSAVRHAVWRTHNLPDLPEGCSACKAVEAALGEGQKGG